MQERHALDGSVHFKVEVSVSLGCFCSSMCVRSATSNSWSWARFRCRCKLRLRIYVTMQIVNHIVETPWLFSEEVSNDGAAIAADGTMNTHSHRAVLSKLLDLYARWTAVGCRDIVVIVVCSVPPKLGSGQTTRVTRQITEVGDWNCFAWNLADAPRSASLHSSFQKALKRDQINETRCSSDILRYYCSRCVWCILSPDPLKKLSIGTIKIFFQISLNV